MMKATLIRIVLLCTLVAGVFLVLPQPAQAAAYHELCLNVAPPGQFCKRCVDVGYHTGACCRNIGTCGCVYTVCPLTAAASSSDVTQEELLLAADLAPTAADVGTEAQPATASVLEASATEGERPADAPPAAD